MTRKHVLKNAILVLSLVFWAMPENSKGQALAIPVDNPYRQRYDAVMPAAPYHWTDSIRWDVVVNIRDYASQVKRIKDPGTLNEEDSLNDWKDAFYAAQTALVNQGGGVLYFPPLPPRYSGPGGVDPGKDSSYFFSDHLFLKSNVILRGETPEQKDARLNTFCPPTYFEFPSYPYSGTFDVPNSVSFKEITVDTAGITGIGKPGFRNIGIVYIDINRGRFAAHPTFRDVTIAGNTYGVANESPRNVLILGMRSNNVAIPDLNIPNAILPASKVWHRWPWRFAANVDVYVSANCIVAGCRMNDYQNNTRNNLRRIQDNSFSQSGYVPNPASANDPPCFPTPDQARFNYNNHYGVIVNRLKKVGYNSVKGFISNATPAQEPELYAPGNEVVDSWIFKTSRVGIHAAGLGLKIKGNVLEDSDTKETIIGPTGATCLRDDYPACNTPTFENRGIDFCGWGVRIDSNTTKAYRIKLLPSNKYSADGEGWYFQGASGSTARDITITRNKFIGNNNGLCDVLCNTNINKGYNGFANSVTIQNVVVRNNDFGSIPFRMRVDGTDPVNYVIRGLRVFDNTNLHSIEVFAKGCGDSSLVYNNTKVVPAPPTCPSGGPDLAIDCFTSINANLAQRNENGNIGFATWPPNPNGDDRTGCGTICATGPACGFPSGTVTDPTGATCFGRNQLVPVTVAYTLESSCTPDSVVLYKQAGIKVETVPGNQLGPGSGEAVFATYRTPTTSWVTEKIYAVVFKGGYSGQSVSRILAECVSVQAQTKAKPSLTVFPNPAQNRLGFRVSETKTIQSVRVVDLSGKTRQALTPSAIQTAGEISLTGMAPGTYFLLLQTNEGTVSQRFVKE